MLKLGNYPSRPIPMTDPAARAIVDLPTLDRPNRLMPKEGMLTTSSKGAAKAAEMSKISLVEKRHGRATCLIQASRLPDTPRTSLGLCCP